MNYKFLTLLLLIGFLSSNVNAQSKNDEEIKKEAEDMRKFLNDYAKTLKNKKQSVSHGTNYSPANTLDSMFVNADFRSSQLDSLRDEVRALNKKIESLIPLIKKAFDGSSAYPGIRENIANKEIGACNCVRVYFSFNSDILEKADLKSLDSISGLWQKNKNLKIKIDGHADRIGNTASNEMISKQRAQSVYNYLVKNKNISPGNISINWLGNTQPYVNTTDQNLLWLNRRAEVFIK